MKELNADLYAALANLAAACIEQDKELDSDHPLGKLVSEQLGTTKWKVLFGMVSQTEGSVEIILADGVYSVREDEILVECGV